MTKEGFDVVIGVFLPTIDWADDPVEWSRLHFEHLADGGHWAIPRSGLMFQRRGDELHLFDVMPYMKEMEGVVTPKQLHEQQQREFDNVALYFGSAGIPVYGAELLEEEA